MTTYTKEHSSIGPREFGNLAFDAKDCSNLDDLRAMGIGLDERTVDQMMTVGMDAIQGLTTTASITTPVQFLQAWLPGAVKIMFAARKIDLLVGRTVAGSWEDEEVVQTVVENTGKAVPYGDYTNIPFASWNQNFERRTIVRHEAGMMVSQLEEARASKVRVNVAGEKRESASLSLEISRNNIGFNGYNSGENRTYGFLNDPNLPAYVAVADNGGATSKKWSAKTFLEITADIREMFIALQTQSKDNIDPFATKTTLAIATDSVGYLGVINALGSQSVKQWLDATYPNCRVESAPELSLANGGASVMYLYAENVNDSSSDDGKTWVQIVPSMFQVLGVARLAKGFKEDYTNATAGVMLKRPYAVVRRTGINS